MDKEKGVYSATIAVVKVSSLTWKSCRFVMVPSLRSHLTMRYVLSLLRCSTGRTYLAVIVSSEESELFNTIVYL